MVYDRARGKKSFRNDAKTIKVFLRNEKVYMHRQ